MNTNTRKTLLASMVGLFAAGGMATATAQDSVGDSARAQNVLDEIIVTAQKREQNLQDTALSIAALSSKSIEARGIDSPLDIQFSVPGLSIGQGFGGTAQVTLRGVGTENVDSGGDPGVPLHIDGHYIQASAYALRDLLDVERVEVLRGPQGTLYGRNAIGGTINIITKKPTDTFEGKVSLDLGNYNKRQVQGVISGPLSDDVKGRLVFSDENRDGFTDNLSTLGSQDIDNSDYTSVRGQLVFNLSENLQATLSAYYDEDYGNTATNRMITPYPTASVPGIVNYFEANGAGENITASDPRKVRMNVDSSGVYNRARGASIDLEWDSEDYIFRSLSSYNKHNQKTITETDTSDVVTVGHSEFPVFYETFSQEFQLLSGAESEFKWILGLFYYDERSDLLSSFDWDNLFVVGGPKSVVDIFQQGTSNSLGVFGQIDYPLTDDLELVLGLRYNSDKKESFANILIPDFGLVGPDGEPVITQDDDDKWTETTGKIGLNYHLNDDAFMYASISTGYKAGGYNGGNPSYDPETVTAYELGLKNSWRENKINTSVSAFLYDYSDKQEFTRNFELGTPVILNSGKATVWGVEVEMIAKPSSALLIDASIGYLNSEYDEFETIDDIVDATTLLDLAGNQLARSPEWKAHIGVEYEIFSHESGTLFARLDSTWVDEQFGTPFNRPGRDEIPSYSLTNVKVSWMSNDEAWQASMYVKNIEDKDVLSNFADSGALVGLPIAKLGQYFEPRTYGLKVTRNF